jgi:hypothetical protein
MASPPLPGGVRRGAVKPPNEERPGDHRANGYLPLSARPSECRPPNEAHRGDRRGGTALLAGMASPVAPPNHRFDVGMAKMPQPGAAETLGVGAVPVNPFSGGGLPAAVMRAKR